MTNTFTIQSLNHQLPLKVLATSVKNMGISVIYILGIEQDAWLPPGAVIPYLHIILQPGGVYNVESSTYFPPSLFYTTGKEVTIHSAGDIDVDIECNGSPYEWTIEPLHPWNGYPFPDGSYTENFKNPSTN